MKRLFIIFIVFTLLFAVLPCFGDYRDEASWEEQIHGMDYLILHLSGINAFNGMNLTSAQVRRQYFFSFFSFNKIPCQGLAKNNLLGFKRQILHFLTN